MTTNESISIHVVFTEGDLYLVHKYITFFENHNTHLIPCTRELYQDWTFKLMSILDIDSNDHSLISCKGNIANIYNLTLKIAVVLSIEPDYLILDAKDYYIYESYFLIRKYLLNSLFGGSLSNRLVSPLINPLTSCRNSEIIHSLDLTQDSITLQRKVTKIPTDSYNIIRYNPLVQPNISMMLQILSRLMNDSIHTVNKKYEDKNYCTLKKDLINEIFKIKSLLR